MTTKPTDVKSNCNVVVAPIRRGSRNWIPSPTFNTPVQRTSNKKRNKNEQFNVRKQQHQQKKGKKIVTCN